MAVPRALWPDWLGRNPLGERSGRVQDALEDVAPGAGGEIQLTDAIAVLLSTQAAHAYEFPGVHFDAGTPLGLLKASVYDALRRPDTAAEFRRWLSETL